MGEGPKKSAEGGVGWVGDDVIEKNSKFKIQNSKFKNSKIQNSKFKIQKFKKKKIQK